MTKQTSLKSAVSKHSGMILLFRGKLTPIIVLVAIVPANERAHQNNKLLNTVGVAMAREVP